MGEFAKAAASGWQDKLQEQESRLHAIVPSQEEEAKARAAELLAKYTALAEALGRKHRLGQQSSMKSLDVLQGLPEAPGREYVAQLGLPPKQASWADYLRDKYEDLRKEMLLGKEHLTRTTSDPATLPWFAPAMATGVPAGFMRGYQEADKGLVDAKKKELDAQLTEAKAQFEQALADEMLAGRKTAAAEFIDNLAEVHCKQGLFEEGDANKYLGYYLAAAALLGKGSDTVAYNLMKKYDPRRVESSAMESAIRERMRMYPTPILVEPNKTEQPEVPSSDLLPDKSPGEVTG